MEELALYRLQTVGHMALIRADAGGNQDYAGKRKKTAEPGWDQGEEDG